MNKTVLLAALILAPVAFASAQEVKVNATGSVNGNTATYNVTADVPQLAEPVNVQVNVDMPTVDMAGVVTTMTESTTTGTTTATTTAEEVVDAEVAAVLAAWDAITAKAQESTGTAWTVVDTTVVPDTLLEGETVEVKGIQEVSLFGFIKFGMTLTAEMDVEGNVTNITKPWFAMFAW